ncbi:alpha-E domain-containing protein [Roseateles violae]|uniref:alpha-E domain-containing protein n=1 Tax=Roseateles violae TaxID=3058042 RepID=UPI00331304F1
MLSRAADHLFWLARYMERAGQARSAWGEAHNTATRVSACGVFCQEEPKHAV